MDDARPITAQLTALSSGIGSCPDSSLSSVISDVQRFFNTLDFDLESDVGPEQRGAWLSLALALIGRCSLPLASDDVSPLKEAQYKPIGARVETVCPALLSMLTALGKNGSGGAVDKGGGVLFAVAPDICVFTVTHFQVAPWSSCSSRSAAQEVMHTLLEAGCWKDSAQMLMGDRKQEGDEDKGRAEGILGGVLDLLLRPEKEMMFRSPWLKLVFSWTLLQVTRPALSTQLPRLLPPSLLLMDHFLPENCVLGVRCVHHIVLNTAGADLRQLNRAEVLHQALFRLLYRTQPQVTEVVLSCLMDVLLVLEKPPAAGPSPSHLKPAPSIRAVGRHDAVLRLVLTQMEAEHKVPLRRVYASALTPLVHRCGITVCRHLKRLGRVIVMFLEVSDPPEETSRIQTLIALNETLRTAWPRMGRWRVEQLLRSVLRLLVDISSDSNVSDSVKQQVFDHSAVSLRLLDACSGGALQGRLLQLDGGHCSPEVLRVLRSASETKT